VNGQIINYPRSKRGFLNGGKYRWNFPNNCPKAGVAFSKSFIKLLFAGFRTQRLFDERLGCEKSLLIGMLWVAPGKKPLPNLQNFKFSANPMLVTFSRYTLQMTSAA
jgi:hypothetical protein